MNEKIHREVQQQIWAGWQKNQRTWRHMKLLTLRIRKKKEWRKVNRWTSLVVQWLRIHLPMQGTRVLSLVREDPTCCGATKPVYHNYRACALEPVNHNYWSPSTLEPVHHNYWVHACNYWSPTHSRARMTQLLKPMLLEPVLCNEKPPQWEAHALQQRLCPSLATTRESPCAATKTQRSQK